MRILIFGATGMVGQSALREALLDPGVTSVTTVVRTPAGRDHPKLREVVVGDLAEIGSREADLAPFDACLYCVGVSAAGRTEASYTHLTYDLTLTVATLLARVNPGLTFVYVSGAGADATERGRFMWARVKGRTENALRRLPLRAAYAVRPAAIQPLHGIRSRTGWYRWLYAALGPVAGLLQRAFPAWITTTERLGRAMIALARAGYEKPVLENADINRIG